uniref:Uncharacterized protein n=1 Tax=Globisporangium ultimum (strain ATCC 200006 / CBS 805.95 / DAOM BR144) TaxID=431595 RepID=K3WTX6_GLOUD
MPGCASIPVSAPVMVRMVLGATTEEKMQDQQVCCRVALLLVDQVDLEVAVWVAMQDRQL